VVLCLCEHSEIDDRSVFEQRYHSHIFHFVVSQRWYRIVARLRTHSTDENHFSDDNHFWKENNRARVQKVRRSLCELLNMPEVLDQQYEPHLVDSNVVNTLRLQKVENDITTMNKTWNTNLLALHSKLDKLLVANVKVSPP
jgi:hypothetical protein